MHLTITNDITLREIQEVFSNHYPYLRLEFFGKRHKKYESSKEELQIEPNIRIGDIKSQLVSGLVEILPTYKVEAVEKEFQTRFGLPVQIMQKENEKWIQTTSMDDFTLRELNEISRNSSDDYIMEEEPDDE
jgi:hypothetical protein